MEPSEKPAGTKSKQHNWIPTLLCWQFFPHILGILVVLLLAAAVVLGAKSVLSADGKNHHAWIRGHRRTGHAVRLLHGGGSHGGFP